MKDQSDVLSHYERMLLPRSYILFPCGKSVRSLCNGLSDRSFMEDPPSYISLPWLEREIAQWVHPMKDRSDDLSHHERTLLPRSYILLPCGKSVRSLCNGLSDRSFMEDPPSYISLPWLEREKAQWVHPVKDGSDDLLHHERTLLPQSYISLRWLEEEIARWGEGGWVKTGCARYFLIS